MREILQLVRQNRTLVVLTLLGVVLGGAYGHTVTRNLDHGLDVVGDHADALTYVNRLQDWAIWPLLTGVLTGTLVLCKRRLIFLGSFIAVFGLSWGAPLMLEAALIDMTVPSGSSGYWHQDPQMQEWEEDMQGLQRELEQGNDEGARRSTGR